MEDLWSLALGLLQLWMFVVVFLIMFPAMFGLSLGVTGVYIQILVKILEWATIRIQRGRQQQPSVPIPLPNGIIKREGGSMEQELCELRHSHPKERSEFALSDAIGASILEPAHTYQPKLPLHQSAPHHHLGLGVFVRYCILFPLRLTLALIGLSWLVAGLTIIGLLPDSSLRSWLSELVHLTCYRICARALSATIRYHNKENRPQRGGICVANHTTPIDIVILANDGCYAMVGQIHGGLMGIIQRAMVRSCPHVWFERSEMKDRHAVTNRRGKMPPTFANRVKSAIASQGGLLDLAWDGSLKRGKVKDCFKEEQQKNVQQHPSWDKTTLARVMEAVRKRAHVDNQGPHLKPCTVEYRAATCLL
ncbi:hypothetical protein WMY93_020650 [Mugilogobius chulae]|uniref:Phospholipid/glycerol acyltransferase domain-containing protein n=1 Tax=Mugilogobius chulae TaxID=88201 RepID=A0AAW0N9L7_9GOBI